MLRHSRFAVEQVPRSGLAATARAAVHTAAAIIALVLAIVLAGFSMMRRFLTSAGFSGALLLLFTDIRPLRCAACVVRAI